jgi:predicted acyltransferase
MSTLANPRGTPAETPEAPAGKPPKPARLVSLDVFRGITMASMVLVNNPGSGHTYAPLEHAEWNGWTFTDTVFPFFLWIVGVAMTLSFARRVEQGDNRGRLLGHAAKRSAIIFATGLLMALIPRFPWATLRIPGVLQRIAVCAFIAAAIFLYTSIRGQLIWIGGLLTVYWMLMTLVPVPGFGPGVLSKEGNFSRWVDGHVLTGHMWSATKVWDPEGVVSTLPAIATVLFGIMAGHILRMKKTPAERTAWLFSAGCGLAFLGWLMSLVMPINKSIWTASFSVFMAGLAFLEFACCYWMIDVQGWRRWTRPTAIFGMNALAVFVVSGMLGKTLGIIRIGDASLKSVIFRTVFEPLASPMNASLLYALANVALMYLFAWAMYRKGWFIRF